MSVISLVVWFLIKRQEMSFYTDQLRPNYIKIIITFKLYLIISL